MGSGSDDYYTEKEAVGQAVFTRLRLLLGEWWEDQEDGLPLFQNILGKRGREQQGADLIIQSRIAETPGVRGIVNYQSSFNNQNRTLSVYCEVQTIYGNVTVEEVF